MTAMLRSLLPSDLPQVQRIEESVHIVPWTYDVFLMCFQAGYKGWVIEINKKIIGFIIVSMRFEECHVLNICVAHSYQRRGYGYKLMTHVLNEAKRLGMGIISLEVRRSNKRAIALYKKMRFQIIGERRNYYSIGVTFEDALVFAKNLYD